MSWGEWRGGESGGKASGLHPQAVSGPHVMRRDHSHPFRPAKSVLAAVVLDPLQGGSEILIHENQDATVAARKMRGIGERQTSKMGEFHSNSPYLIPSYANAVKGIYWSFLKMPGILLFIGNLSDCLWERGNAGASPDRKPISKGDVNFRKRLSYCRSWPITRSSKDGLAAMKRLGPSRLPIQ